MGNTMTNARRSDPVRSLDNIRPPALKADTKRSDGRTVTQIMSAAVIKHYGSVKAAAISLRVDPSLMQREFDAGKFGRLDDADEETKAAIAEALKTAFPGSDPKAIARRMLREARQRIDEAMEQIADRSGTDG